MNRNIHMIHASWAGIISFICGALSAVSSFLLQFSWSSWAIDTGTKLVSTGLIAFAGGFLGLAGKAAFERIFRKRRTKDEQVVS